MATETLVFEGRDSTGNQVTATLPVEVGTTPQVVPTLLGCNMNGRSSLGSYRPLAARTYRKNAADKAIDVYQARLVCHSPTDVADTPTATEAECRRLTAKAAAKGYALRGHSCTDNEADRHFGNLIKDSSGQPSISTWVGKQEAQAAAAHKVPGWEHWGNFTRDGISAGRNDLFRAGFPFLDGIALNCYSTGMEKNPPTWTDFKTYIDPMMDWVQRNGFQQVGMYEGGTRVSPLFDRAEWASAFVDYYIAAAVKRGVKPVVLNWWDPGKDYNDPNRISAFEDDGMNTLNAWAAKQAQLALAA